MSYLLAGLGNVGDAYDDTRHNIGFNIVNHLSDKFDSDFELGRHAYICAFKHKGKSIYMIKPTTFMNLSGKAVRYWMSELKIKRENLLVILDDLDLEYGRLKLKTKGSHGGHNGLKDIDAILGDNKYARLRFGIGDNFPRGKQVDYVLGKWSNSEYADLHEHVTRAADASLDFISIGAQRTMENLNRKKSNNIDKDKE